MVIISILRHDPGTPADSSYPEALFESGAAPRKPLMRVLEALAPARVSRIDLTDWNLLGRKKGRRALKNAAFAARA